MNYWLAIVGMSLITFGIRYALFAFAASVRFPPTLERALHYVPPAVLSAIVFPAVLMPDGHTLALDWRNPYLVGAVVAIAVSALTRKLLLTTIVGMAVFFACKALLA